MLASCPLVYMLERYSYNKQNCWQQVASIYSKGVKISNQLAESEAEEEDNEQAKARAKKPAASQHSDDVNMHLASQVWQINIQKSQLPWYTSEHLQFGSLSLLSLSQEKKEEEKKSKHRSLNFVGTQLGLWEACIPIGFQRGIRTMERLFFIYMSRDCCQINQPASLDFAHARSVYVFKLLIYACLRKNKLHVNIYDYLLNYQYVLLVYYTRTYVCMCIVSVG